METELMIKCATEASEAGMPEDQMRSFFRAGYIPLPAMAPFHAAARLADRAGGPDAIALGGTRGPGKSHAVMAQVGLDDCQRHPGLKFLFLRRVMKSAAESFEDLIYRVFLGVQFDFKPSLGRVVFPNGSKILIGGFNNEADIDKYLGIEYDGLVIEEATQLSENKVQMIEGSVRSSVPGWRARKYYSTNPDGIGLAWFKKRFVIPWREHSEYWTRFFNLTYKENPFLKDEYTRYLEGLSGPLAKAWRDGDWDAFEGMAFPNWNEQAHVIAPFDIPDEWPKWNGIDDGYSAPWCVLWMARDPDSRRVYAYREVYQQYKTPSQQAQIIKDLTPPNERVSIRYADPAMWAQQKVKDIVLSPEQTYRDSGLILTKADNTRITGKRRVDQLLGNLPDGLPGIQIFRNCDNLVRTLPELARSKVNQEDVDTDMEDHAYDALRYGTTNLPAAAIPTRATAQRQSSDIMRVKVL